MKAAAAFLLTLLAVIASAQAPPVVEAKEQWLLVWVAANVSGASLPEQQRFENKEKCEMAAQTLNELTAKTGIANLNVPISVRAACIEVPVTVPDASEQQ